LIDPTIFTIYCPMEKRARYVPSAAKALEVILWFANRRPGIDIYHLVKGAFYADKFHVGEYGRPITGDEYRAAPFGPLPHVIYGLLRRQPIEMIALAHNGPLPFSIDALYRVYAERHQNDRKLSASDVRALEHGFSVVDGKTFDELVDMTHEDPAYANAVAGHMDYADFIAEDAPDRDKKREHLREVAPHVVF
jgi:hypothetical protein